MIIKSLQLTLHLSQSESLKDKRRILKSIKDRCRQKYNVAICELSENDDIKNTVIAIVTVTNSDAYADKTLDKCFFLLEDYYNIDVVKIKRERH